MYTNFRINLQVGYSSDFKCFTRFNKHDKKMEMELVLNEEPRGDQDSQEKAVSNGNTGNVLNCMALNYDSIQARLVFVTRRRGRGDMGVVTNAEMHSLNGNRGNFMDALFQNIPGRQSKLKDKQLAITSILEKFKPALLGLAEPTTEDLEKIDIPGYSLVRGTLKRGRKIRLNVLVKDGVKYKIEKFCSEVPASLITIDKFKVLYYKQLVSIRGFEDRSVHFKKD